MNVKKKSLNRGEVLLIFSKNYRILVHFVFSNLNVNMKVTVKNLIFFKNEILNYYMIVFNIFVSGCDNS